MRSPQLAEQRLAQTGTADIGTQTSIEFESPVPQIELPNKNICIKSLDLGKQSQELSKKRHVVRVNRQAEGS